MFDEPIHRQPATLKFSELPWEGSRLLQRLNEFSPGLDQNGDVRVGILPECEEFVVGRLGLFFVLGKCMGAGQLQSGQSSDGLVANKPRMVDDLLKFGDGSITLLSRQVSFTSQINGIEKKIQVLKIPSHFIRCRRGQSLNRFRRLRICEPNRSSNSRQIVKLDDGVLRKAFREVATQLSGAGRVSCQRQ